MEPSHPGNHAASTAHNESTDDNLMDLSDDSKPPPSIVSEIIKQIEAREDDAREDKPTEKNCQNSSETKTNLPLTGESKSKKDESEDEFYYISEDELDDVQPKKQYLPNVVAPRGLSPPPINQSSTSTPNHKMSYAAAAAASPQSTIMSNSIAGPSSKPQQPPSPSNMHNTHTNSFKELSQLGHFVEINPNSDTAKLISLYARNGIIGSSSLRVKVDKIYQIDKQGKQKSSLFASAKNVFLGKSSTNGFKMLLWCKTTPESIRRLAQSKNSCTAFYDRLCRALPFPVQDIKNTLHERILLCKVDLGKMHKSPHGYPRWSTEPCAPLGCDSVKGNGQFRPNWHQNRKLDEKKGVIVPCGETERDTRYSKFELEFNEYFVYTSKQIKVQFVVDIEISRK